MSSVFLRLCMSVSTCSFSTISIYLCRVFGQRDPSGFIPSPLERYRQILLPTLRLLQVILTSTTTHHQQGAAQVQFLLMHSCAYGPHWLVCNCFVCVCVCLQVLHWLIVYSDTIQSVLHSQDVSMGSLQELSLLTGIISKTALPGTQHLKKMHY